MKKLPILSILFLIVSCGGMEAKRGVSPSLLPVYEKLEKDIGTTFTCFATYAEQVSLNPSESGQTYHGPKLILIRNDVAAWPSWHREEVLLHEIGHVEYGLEDEDSGIMQYKHDSDYNEEQYIKEKAEFIERIHKIIESRSK